MLTGTKREKKEETAKISPPLLLLLTAVLRRRAAPVRQKPLSQIRQRVFARYWSHMTKRRRSLATYNDTHDLTDSRSGHADQTADDILPKAVKILTKYMPNTRHSSYCSKGEDKVY